MAKSNIEVNLDALIQREDFDIEETGAAKSAAQQGKELYIQTLIPEERLANLRKPDFQRETSSWTPEIVYEFILSVADADVIPALILWRSPISGKSFVIDGAHRLSAVIAWINNDYGDGEISKAFYGNSIPSEQLEAAEKTRNLIESNIGKFAVLKGLSVKKDAPNPVAERRSNNILSVPLSIQAIEGDAQAAERSYKRINSTAVAINRQELRLIDSRRYPVGIATRALMRAGTGYEYWSQFPEPTKSDISKTAALIYNELIAPIAEYPGVALDLPTKRGIGPTSLATILDLVEILNSPIRNAEKDTEGRETLKYLERVQRATERVFGKSHIGSLALHPALYCYDAKGKFVGKAFIGAIQFVIDLIKKDKVFSFTEQREKFEDFLIEHRHLISQIGKTQGSGGKRGVPAVVALYWSIFDACVAGLEGDRIVEKLKDYPALKFLDWEKPVEIPTGKKASAADKAQAVIKQALDGDICTECRGRMYIKDRSIDHVTRLVDGGKSVASNLIPIHPYCNTGFKEKKLHLQSIGERNG